MCPLTQNTIPSSCIKLNSCPRPIKTIKTSYHKSTIIQLTNPSPRGCIGLTASQSSILYASVIQRSKFKSNIKNLYKTYNYNSSTTYSEKSYIPFLMEICRVSVDICEPGTCSIHSIEETLAF